MIAFRLNNEYIDLFDNASLSIEAKSPLFAADAIPGTRIYTFSARKTRKNQRLFQFAEKIAVKSVVSYPNVEAHLFNALWKVGELKLRDASPDRYNLSFHTDAGDLAGKIKGKKLADLDLGTGLLDISTGTLSEIYPERKYTLFPIKNLDFYGDKNIDYAGYMNYYKNDFVQNTDAGGRPQNTNCLVPFPFLLYILNRIAQQLGYLGVSGPWTEEEDIKRLVIYNNYALDKLVDGRNAYNQQIDFRNHVPDMEIGKFLIAIKNLFGLSFFINPRTRYIEITKLQDVVRNTNFQDMNRLASAEYQKTPYQGNGFLLSMKIDNADELSKELSTTDYNYQIEGTEEKFETEAGTLFQIDEEDQITGNRSWSIPQTRQRGSSPEFELGINNFSLRLLFYHGLQPDSQGNLYPQASSEGSYYKLGYSGFNGLYERCWKDWLDMLQASDQVETTFRWGAYELQNFNFRNKIIRDYSKFLIREYRVSISQIGVSPTQVTLQKVRV